MKVILSALLLIMVAGAANAQEKQLFVSDAGNLSAPPWKILRYDEDGTNPQLFTNTNLGWPQDIVFLEDGTVIISNLNTGRITQYDADTGEYLGNFATGISGPTRMKFGPDGLLYVLQWQGNGRILRFQADGTFVDEFSTQGVNQAIGLDWDTQGNLYVSSFNGAFIRKYSPAGNDLGIFISSNLQGPTNIWFDDAGDLLVADWSGGAIRRFDSNGNFRFNFATGLNQPEGVAELPNGDVLIGNGGTASVRQYNENGILVSTVVASGSGGLIQPNAVVIREVPEPFVMNAGLNDAWVNADAPFQGMFVTIFPDLKLVFIAWFTFDSDVPVNGTAVFGAADQRWVTGLGSYTTNKAELNMELTTGGAFNSNNPLPTQDTAYGTMTLEFNDCASGTVTFNFPAAGQAGTFSIARVVGDNIALCESLAGGTTQ